MDKLPIIVKPADKTPAMARCWHCGETGYYDSEEMWFCPRCRANYDKREFHNYTGR